MRAALVMAQLSVIIAVLLAAPIKAMAEVGPSFPCPEPHDPLANLICSSPLLSRDDLKMVQAYQALRFGLPASGQDELTQEAIAFTASVTADCGVPPVGSRLSASPSAIPCVDERYRKQRGVYASRLTGAPAEEADRPLAQHTALQQDLQTLGFLPSDAAIDGDYGPVTRAAIESWQQSRGLTVTGFLARNDADLLAAQAGNQGNRPLPVAEPTARSGQGSDILRLIVQNDVEAYINGLKSEMKYPTVPVVQVRVSAPEMSQQYSANEIAADEEFKGKHVLISGVIEDVSEDFSGQPYVEYAVPDISLMDVDAYLAPDAVEEAAGYSPGQTVDLVCLDTGGEMGSPDLKDCEDAGFEAAKLAGTLVGAWSRGKLPPGFVTQNPKAAAIMFMVYWVGSHLAPGTPCLSPPLGPACLGQIEDTVRHSAHDSQFRRDYALDAAAFHLPPLPKLATHNSGQ